MAPKKSPAPAPIEDKNTVAIPRPRLHKLTVNNFRAFGSEPVTLELDDIVAVAYQTTLKLLKVLAGLSTELPVGALAWSSMDQLEAAVNAR